MSDAVEARLGIRRRVRPCRFADEFEDDGTSLLEYLKIEKRWT